jgi:phosphoserine phosphatase
MSQPIALHECQSTHAVVLIGTAVARALAEVAPTLARRGIAVHAAFRLGDRRLPAIELRVSGLTAANCSERELRKALADRLAVAGVCADIVVEPVERRRCARRLVAFDVDSTLLQDEIIDLLASRADRATEVAAITDAAMQGAVDFTTALQARVALLAGLDAAVLTEIRVGLRLTDGVRTTVRTLRRNGYLCGAISGGFTQIVGPLAVELGMDFYVANELEIRDGRLTGRIVGRCVDRPGKGAALRAAAERYGIPLSHCVAVGDGANDIDMISDAGLGVAFNAKPALRDVADVILSHPTMEPLLSALGIRTHELAEHADGSSVADDRAAA